MKELEFIPSLRILNFNRDYVNDFEKLSTKILSNLKYVQKICWIVNGIRSIKLLEEFITNPSLNSFHFDMNLLFFGDKLLSGPQNNMFKKIFKKNKNIEMLEFFVDKNTAENFNFFEVIIDCENLIELKFLGDISTCEEKFSNLKTFVEMNVLKKDIEKFYFGFSNFGSKMKPFNNINFHFSEGENKRGLDISYDQNKRKKL